MCVERHVYMKKYQFKLQRLSRDKIFSVALPSVERESSVCFLRSASIIAVQPGTSHVESMDFFCFHRVGTVQSFFCALVALTCLQAISAHDSAFHCKYTTLPAAEEYKSLVNSLSGKRILFIGDSVTKYARTSYLDTSRLTECRGRTVPCQKQAVKNY